MIATTPDVKLAPQWKNSNASISIGLSRLKLTADKFIGCINLMEPQNIPADIKYLCMEQKE